jgi:hypothetical protein
MKLDELLSRLTVDQLQDLAAIWAPDAPLSNSKLELFRALRDEMTRADRAAHCLEAATAAGRGVIRKLLRSNGRSQSVAVLAASSSPQPRSVEATRRLVEDLATMALVVVEPERRWETYGSARANIPDELVAPLREATGIDDRGWPEILHLRDHLVAQTDDPAGVGDELAALIAPDAVAARVAALPDDLREMVERVVFERGGIARIDALLVDFGLEMPEIREAAVGRWRSELEAARLGTVGDVSLLEYGIDLDGKVLAVFTEVATAMLRRPLADGPDLPDPVGPDFLLDLGELLSTVRQSGAKLKASGELTAAASDRIIARLNRPELALIGPYDLLELRLAAAGKLELLDRGEQTLEIGANAWPWEQQPYERKAADLLGLVGRAAPVPRSRHHHDGLCDAAGAVLREMPPGQWRRGGSTAGLILRRYLGRLDEAELRPRIADAVGRIEHYVLPAFPSLRRLLADVHDALVLEAYAMGVLDLVVEHGAVVAERLSEFGAVAAGRPPITPEPGRLVATPDFEVLLLPEGDTVRLRYEVGQFAAREKFEQTVHLRISKERVEEAVVRGLTADAMIAVLARHSAAGPPPQNVAYSIRGWAERVRVAAAEHAVVFELGDAALLDVVAELPAIKDLTIRRLSPTALALRAWPGDRRLLAGLRRLGVYVR